MTFMATLGWAREPTGSTIAVGSIVRAPLTLVLPETDVPNRQEGAAAQPFG